MVKFDYEQACYETEKENKTISRKSPWHFNTGILGWRQEKMLKGKPSAKSSQWQNAISILELGSPESIINSSNL